MPTVWSNLIFGQPSLFPGYPLYFNRCPLRSFFQRAEITQRRTCHLWGPHLVLKVEVERIIRVSLDFLEPSTRKNVFWLLEWVSGLGVFGIWPLPSLCGRR